jgi:hypothetical protein
MAGRLSRRPTKPQTSPVDLLFLTPASPVTSPLKPNIYRPPHRLTAFLPPQGSTALICFGGRVLTMQHLTLRSASNGGAPGQARSPPCLSSARLLTHLITDYSLYLTTDHGLALPVPSRSLPVPYRFRTSISPNVHAAPYRSYRSSPPRGSPPPPTVLASAPFCSLRVLLNLPLPPLTTPLTTAD